MHSGGLSCDGNMSSHSETVWWNAPGSTLRPVQIFASRGGSVLAVSGLCSKGSAIIFGEMDSQFVLCEKRQSYWVAIE